MLKKVTKIEVTRSNLPTCLNFIHHKSIGDLKQCEEICEEIYGRGIIREIYDSNKVSGISVTLVKSYDDALSKFIIDIDSILKILSTKANYILETNLNSLSDKFKLISLSKNSKKKLFREKDNRNDFRINPTFINSKKFSDSISRVKIQSPNFFDAKRIHLIIKKMIESSKTNKKVFIK